MTKQEPKQVDRTDGMTGEQLRAVNDGEIPAIELLNAAGYEAVDLAIRIEEIEGELHALKARLTYLQTERMPDLMDEIGFASFKLKTGAANQHTHEFTLARGMTGSFPKDPTKNRAAVEWLEQNEADGIIKTRLHADFPRSEWQAAQEIAHAISNRCDPIVSATVHPSTLKKFARDKLDAGEEIDLEKLGLYLFRQVKIKGDLKRPNE